jgi:hypothetical protein
VLGPPRLWGWLWAEWCPLPASLAWVLWRAVLKAQWSTATQWREQFLAFEKPDRVLSRDLVEAFLAEHASPQQMMALVEQLMEERRLLKRDGRQVQDRLLAHVDRHGEWKHRPRRRVS